MNIAFFKKKKVLISAAIVLLAALVLIAAFWVLRSTTLFGKPTLTVETPPKKAFGDAEPFSVEMTVSSLGQALYPAASFSIEFDSSHLEFLGVEEGNIRISGEQTNQSLPDWSVNVEKSNKDGKINIIYVDQTGGKYAFSKSLLAKSDNVVLRLRFRLRGSARVGEVYPLTVTDAVFAASDETQSLATVRGTLRVRNGKIIVGDAS